MTTAVEHHAVLETCEALEQEGFSVTYLRPDGEGRICLADIERAVRPDTVLVSVMWANNEAGTVNPVDEIGAFLRERGILFHVDAVQAVGHLPIDVVQAKIDLLSLSAHKFHGPKGVGALYIREGVRVADLMDGGAQERGRRAGTENVAGIVGMGEAMRLAEEELSTEAARQSAIRDYTACQAMSTCPSRACGRRSRCSRWTWRGSPARVVRPVRREQSGPHMCCSRWGCRTRACSRRSVSAFRAIRRGRRSTRRWRN